MQTAKGHGNQLMAYMMLVEEQVNESNPNVMICAVWSTDDIILVDEGTQLASRFVEKPYS